ncbi:hypothetical protein [Streptomyces sp. NPDC057794]|uniref:hypothetical protein n=1 Tax=Streptomyces sp. NPDC057794 TaxID=3346251 RepID=UPI0036ACE624
MTETRRVGISASAYDRLAAAAAAEGVSVRVYLERIAEGLAPGQDVSGARRAPAGAGPDPRLVALGVADPCGPVDGT